MGGSDFFYVQQNLGAAGPVHLEHDRPERRTIIKLFKYAAQPFFVRIAAPHFVYGLLNVAAPKQKRT